MVDERLWGGIDLGKEIVSICITDNLGEIVLERVVEARPGVVFGIFEAISDGRLAMIGVEAGSGAYLVRKLRALGLPIAVLETRKASKVLALRRHKTDTNDARGLADIVRLGGAIVSRVHEKSIESRRIRTQLTLRQQIVRQRVAVEQVLRTMLQEYGGESRPSKRASALRPNIEAALDALVEREQVNLRDEAEPLLSLCESMRRYEEAIDRRLSILARDHPICRRFLDVPGVGPVAALSFYSAVDDPDRFARIEDVACFLGLTPRLRESGKHVERPRISKMGNRMTRAHLAMSASILLNVCREDSTL